MAFNVSFYTFAKRQKSTAVPSGAGQTVSCHANETLDILAPEIVLDWRQEQGLPTGYNYAHIPDFGRWYWITGWNNDGGIWTARLQVDALASFKTQLGGNSIYIYRSASSYDGDLVDTLYPANMDVRYQMISFNNPIKPNPFTTTYGAQYVLGLIGGSSCVTHRIFTWPQLTDLFSYIMNDGYYIDVLGIFGASQYPEAKTVLNPLQYITDIRAYPFSLTGDAVLQTSYSFGTLTIQASGSWTFGCYQHVDGNGVPTDVITKTVTIDLTQLSGHPQQSRGLWINARHARYNLSVPPFGVIPLDPVLVADSVALYLVFTLDLNTGICQLCVYYQGTGSTTPPNTQLSSPIVMYTSVGIDVPISHVMQPGYSITHMLQDLLPAAATVAGGLMSGNPLIAATGAVNMLSHAVGSSVESRIPKASQINQQSSLANYQLNSAVYAEYTMLADDDLAGRGRPLCQVRQISGLSGYIVGDPDEIQISGALEPELHEIRSAVSEGFYYA